ncbi:hypothetical protein [Streptomyces sp. NPDC020983]|uniref:hypothetical protein n=1 Tax=Streptomyces sp. NPDC020983 TaxID=3365106 RepID=UPI00379DD010
MLCAVAGLLCLAGCGIPTTGVVEAGEPGSGIRPATTLYFVRAADGSLATVEREEGVQLGTEGALKLLFAGPGPMEEKFFGLTTLVGAPPSPFTVHRAKGRLTVDLGPDAGRLPPGAVDQIVCTATTAEAVRTPAAAPPDVTVTAAGRPLPGSLPGPAACPAVSSATPVAPEQDGANRGPSALPVAVPHQPQTADGTPGRQAR